MENWLAGGLTTEVPKGGISGVSEVSSGVSQGMINIRSIKAERRNTNVLYFEMVYDSLPKEGENYCGITITGRDDQGKPYNIAENLLLQKGNNLKHTDMIGNFNTNATEITLNFQPDNPYCSINVPSYTVKIGGGPVTIAPPLKPKLIIDQSTIKIDENGKFSVFLKPQGADCEGFTVSFYNITQGENILSSMPRTISSPQIYSFQLTVGNNFNPGDTIRVRFNSNNCDVNIEQVDIQTKKAIAVSPLKKPIINLDIRGIYGQQTIRINLEDLKIKDILEQALGVAAIQRNLYDPPFSMYLMYNVTQDDNPPSNSGYCTIYGRLRGVVINQLSFDKTKAVSYTTFNRDFSFNINYEENRKGPYNKPIYLPLPGNLLGFINLELYHYTGNCEVKFKNQDISESPVNLNYDIETGKFYSVSGNILRDLFGF